MKDGSSIVLPLVPPPVNSDPTAPIVSSDSLSKQQQHASRRGGPRRASGTVVPPTSSASLAPAGRLKVYKSNSNKKWVTREIAALEFLLGIPMEAERDIVHQGYQQQQGVANAHPLNEITTDNVPEDVEVPTNHLDDTRSAGISTSLNSTAVGLPPLSSGAAQGRWWEKWIPQSHGVNPQTGDQDKGRMDDEEEELEQPGEVSRSRNPSMQHVQHTKAVVPVAQAPGRRLEGDDATLVQIPLTDDSTLVTRQKSIARMAATREWELHVAHGLGNSGASSNLHESSGTRPIQPPMLDGRMFFSAGGSYPLQVFSLIRYEPKKEEAIRRRQKLEARGGGGTEFFIMPMRDWRGISYRALLPVKEEKSNEEATRFDRFTHNAPKHALDEKYPKLDSTTDATSEDDDVGSLASEDETGDTYVVGLLDDPEMVQGRHRNVMIGDRSSGPIISSTIQFVKPKLLKADLNKQFRERFDGWEPPKSQRKFIGARVVDGVYTLLDPGTTGEDGTVNEDGSHQQTTATNATTSSASSQTRKRQGSVSSMSTLGAEAVDTIRMPPSLTLSKIRSAKQQALMAAVKAKLEISTVALAIVYFERLCLDCRVDKSNRRLSFAACLLLAIKINEAHVAVLKTKPEEENSKSKATSKIQSLIRPSKKSNSMFASLLEFFTQEWEISLKHLFAAEWGVLAALQFRLHAKPSQVAFHFRRLMKSLEKNPRTYLGDEVFGMWQEALVNEEYERSEREAQIEARNKRKEEKKLMQLQMELDTANRRERSPSPQSQISTTKNEEGVEEPPTEGDTKELTIPPGDATSPKRGSRHTRIGGIFGMFAQGKRAHSTDKLVAHEALVDDDVQALPPHLMSSPSMPTISQSFKQVAMGDEIEVDLQDNPHYDSSSRIAASGSEAGSDIEGGIRF